MKLNKIVSTLLAVLMLFSALSVLVTAEDTEAEAPEYTYNTVSGVPTIDYIKGEVTDPETKTVSKIENPEDKLATMDLRLEKDGYQLYVDAYSGEVAVRNIASGEVLFSNPYLVGRDNPNKKVTPETKEELLSQLIVEYTDITKNTTKKFYSFTDASKRGQIIVKAIKNGIRVEYTIGRAESKYLLPIWIEKSAMETKILPYIKENMTKWEYQHFVDQYMQMDPNANPPTTDLDTMNNKYPITKKGVALYVLREDVNSVEKAKLEMNYIKTWCPHYTYEELDADHMAVEYVGSEDNPPLFKMALEYRLDEDGFTVRLPANGIRFNETLYRLESLEILPFMGAGINTNEGYTFFPDGSGALFDFASIAALGQQTKITGKVYGEDYAYHDLEAKYEQVIRYPVYGMVENESIYDTIQNPNYKPNEDGSLAEDPNNPFWLETVTKKQRGFFAIVEEGASMMDLTSFHAGTSNFNSVRMTVYPRPQDEYNVADAISVGDNQTWTVVSERKYTGNYKIRYILLTSDEVAQKKGIEDYFTTSYVGMANAYRKYLEKEEILTRLDEDDVKEDIPLYIETFGSALTTKKVLSIPVDVMAPLTSFEDIQQMYDDFSDEEVGITNINFILTGYTKGGMNAPQVPYHLKWEKSVGGAKGFEELLAYAEEKDFGVFPDFDFAFVSGNGMFDGLNLKRHAVKTIDNRYTSRRVYSTAKQTYISYFELAISPAYFSHFYEKLSENYKKYEPMGISVSTLGQYLNSDFDEDEPYNRADGQRFTEEALAYLSENYTKVMTAGGNSYSWKYVDYITDIALDSSRYAQAYASVPFLGMVLHGYVQFAGAPVNMEGNISYAFLKAIENGAGLYFTLSYSGYELLKADEVLNQYYSVRYDIWFDDAVSLYQELNGLLSDVQTSIIVDHKYVDGVRIPDADELAMDAKTEMEQAIAAEKAREEQAALAHAEALLNAQKTIKNGFKDLTKWRADVDAYLSVVNSGDALLADTLAAYQQAYNEYVADNTKYTATLEVQKGLTDLVNLQIYGNVGKVYLTKVNAEATITASEEALALLKTQSGLPATEITYLEGLIASMRTLLNEINDKVTEAEGKAAATYNTVKDAKTLDTVPKELFAEYARPVVTPEQGDQEQLPEDNTVVEAVNKYLADTNSIAYVEYENGTAFILNFNNYAVRTEINGVSYTVSAYGYFKLN